jgi:tricorn protease
LEQYLPYVASENDFDYLLSQLQGEVGTSHAYYSGAPSFGPQEHIALLGADLELDAATGLYRFAHIFHGDNSRPLYRSPLQASGVGVQEGDYLIAIDGAPLRTTTNPYELLTGKTDKVTLTTAKSPLGATRTVTIRPLTQEVALREHDWVERNRALVDKLSSGRLGYVYLSNMEERGTEEFIQQYYPQQDKKGMIFDIRWDNGGYTSQMILERLRRTLAGVYLNREDACSGLPDGVMAGPKAVVINHETASDGDQFAYFFRQYGLGPVIGTRSWGGVRGILGAWPLMNGATIFVPKDVLLTPSGKRIIEDEGTSPDIEVDAALTGDADPQLQTAVSALLPKLSPPPQVTCVAKSTKQTPVIN